jgi:TolB-like protein
MGRAKEISRLARPSRLRTCVIVWGRIPIEEVGLRTYTTLLVAAFAAVALAVQDAPAQSTVDVPTVAVLDFTGFMLGEAGNSVAIGKAVSAMLVTEFSGREGMRVVERARLNDLLTEQRLALSGRVEESSAIEVGKLLGVQYVFYGQITSIADNLRIDIRATDVETSEVISVLKKNDKTEELLAVIVWIADEFAKKLNLATPASRPDVEPIPVRATIEFSRAVDFEDKGDTAKAIEFYQKALDVYPNHRDAQLALARLRGGDV